MAITEKTVLLILVGIIFVYWWYARPRQISQIRTWEADQPKKKRSDNLGRTKNKKQSLLTGISIQGPPHEILGVSIDASMKEIQTAYRDLMKHYHPDRVGKQESPEWHEAQKIAVALTQARDDLIARLKQQ